MKKIDSVQMVRNIRDQQNKDTYNKSRQEIIDYFRGKAKQITKKLELMDLKKR